MIKNADNTALQDNLLRLAAAHGGFATSEVDGHTSKQVGPVAEALVRAGKLHRAKISHRVIRYFASEAQASAFTSTSAAKPAKPAVSVSPRTKATWAKDAPMNITADTKITVAPPPPVGIYKTNTHSR